MSDEQFERLKKELDDQYQGTANAGRPLLLEGGLDWKAMSLSPKDMDFMEAKHRAAREIALAFGVPPMLLGDPRRQHLFELSGGQPRVLAADRAAARQPHRRGAGALAGAGLRRGADACRSTPTRSTRCRADRAALWDRVTKAPFLTVNEKRAATGYGAVRAGIVATGCEDWRERHALSRR